MLENRPNRRVELINSEVSTIINRSYQPNHVPSIKTLLIALWPSAGDTTLPALTKVQQEIQIALTKAKFDGPVTTNEIRDGCAAWIKRNPRAIENLGGSGVIETMLQFEVMAFDASRYKARVLKFGTASLVTGIPTIVAACEKHFGVGAVGLILTAGLLRAGKMNYDEHKQYSTLASEATKQAESQRTQARNRVEP